MGRGSVQPITSHQPDIIFPCRGGAVETVTPDLWTWWVDQPLGSGAQIAEGNTVTEVEVDEHLTARRKAQPGFVDCSFPTIAGNIPPPFSTIAPRKRARLRGAAPRAALLTLALSWRDAADGAVAGDMAPLSAIHASIAPRS